jgi:hypothetical protein
MKKFILLIFGIILLQTAVLAQDYDTPVGYMDVINKQSESIAKKFLSYNSAVAHGKRARKVENLRSKLLDEVQDARMNIGSMPSFKGDKSYRDTSVSFMKLYFNILNEDYSKIINMEDIAEQSYDDMEAYIMAQEMVDKKLQEANDKMKAAQREFAKKNNVTLTENSDNITDMMKQVGEVNIYYHQVYLIFFRPYNQEDNMLKALQKNNITGIEQNKSSLLKYAQDGLQKLAATKPFEGDNSLVAACRKMLDFYAMEAGEKMKSVSDYYLTKERFDAIKKEYDRKSSPSKEDVDAYNKSVNEINAASQAFNSNSQMLNRQRSESLNEWNKAVNNFFDEHTPRYR